MILADLKDNRLNRMRDDFNLLYHNQGQKLLSMSSFQLQKAVNDKWTSQEWKEFRLHDKVDEWFEEEMQIIIKNRAFDLLQKTGEDRSTATTQALTQMMNFLDKNKQKAVNPTIMIYSFVPLTEMEEQAPNVRTLTNIPTEIKDAVVVIRES